MRQISQSEAAFKEAKTCFPGGVNSPVRAFGSVGGSPLFIDHAKGAHIYDVDGNDYVDYVLSWGPMILGHAQEHVVKAVMETAQKGTSFGAPSPLETELAKWVKKRVPSMEEMRMVNSGTEATMSAIRLARGCTGREKIIKFNGCYHGHSDSFLVNAGSGVATFELEDSPGVPKDLVKATLSLDFNDLDSVKETFERYPDDIAAVIIEPIAGNMGLIPADPNFLSGIKELTEQYGALFILDEVMTGFRCDYDSAQGLYGIDPDLTTLGKVVGGGLPAAVFGGKKQYMDSIAPLGAVYQAGTLSGNPLAMAAGIATLEQLTRDDYKEMNRKVVALTTGIKEAAKKHGVPIQTTCRGTMWGFFFNEEPVTNFNQSKASDQTYFAHFHKELLNQGIYLAPSQFETNFMSTAHTNEDIDKTIVAFNRTFDVLKENGIYYDC
ncbi:TPA: glutamate-1-semialdehyde 2,1-aminomutase [Enterococcus faecalis]|uniref:glutamate-1-semialdehyde 2,1-aminomutase n=1 Tax=Enterococcus faecalis TaxID=1351 RepID=UPI0011438978|nr:glutamate-1-semialdehyde 2,1-aminomutase [Enterococcus faecalis]EHV0153386.1 glutamate-1-semialdehyde 2,1-aminomutase [Enterococcus faecalis]NSV46799.1 glutamate-1-semialdehyde 2,1-aminomutase [Enterococcus faecalis]TQA42054.1 glutamate-1-semialdehyde-2,1-aminomutase [Enterococcus faecalis]HDT8169893.1 glutamate-1-semialdehyde 2,1-aminomutase [Enterococcus faecalis]